MTERADRGRVVPISRTIAEGDVDPIDLFRRLRSSGEECFLLESVEGGEVLARYTFLGVAPAARLAVRGAQVEIEREGKRQTSRRPLLESLDAFSREEGFAPAPGMPPLCAGAVGYLGYDAARLLEEIPDRHPRESDLPDALFLRFESVVAFDRLRRRLVATTMSAGGDEGGAKARLDRVESFLAAQSPAETPPDVSGTAFTPAMAKEDFLAAVRSAKEAILSGEIYQVVLSQRWTGALGADPLDVYGALRILNPSPYLFYLETRDGVVFGASPEMLVRVRGRTAETRPIAGTIHRGRTSDEDDALAAHLLRDPKERAEHVMLVDLGRNDLGRVSETGTVRVTRSAEIERYSHVQHIVSEVRGTLAEGKRGIDALGACFPAGTLTGAPKIRAMELIDSLEATRRGVYGGAVGYVDCSGNLDMAIAIRTAVVEKGICRIQAGAGIVADSVAENEYREAESKAEALFRAVDVARGTP
jgi:anthranilate synthase component 1